MTGIDIRGHGIGGALHRRFAPLRPHGDVALPASLYTHVWRTTAPWQVIIVALTAVMGPLATVPLELQRRMVDDAIAGGLVRSLAVLGALWLLVIVFQGGMKYVLNIIRARVFETVTRDLRLRVLADPHGVGSSTPVGTFVAILVAESEEVGGFAADSFAVPVLQISTILSVFVYLASVEPLIAGAAILLYAPQAVLVPLVQQRINRLIRMKTIRLRLLGGDETAILSHPDLPVEATRGHARRVVAHLFAIRMRIFRLKYALTFLGNFLDAMGPLLVLTIGGILVIRGETGVATLVVFISGLQKVGDPWDVLVNFFRTVSIARVSYGMIGSALSGVVPPHVSRLSAQHARRAAVRRAQAG